MLVTTMPENSEQTNDSPTVTIANPKVRILSLWSSLSLEQCIPSALDRMSTCKHVAAALRPVKSDVNLRECPCLSTLSP